MHDKTRYFGVRSLSCLLLAISVGHALGCAALMDKDKNLMQPLALVTIGTTFPIHGEPLDLDPGVEILLGGSQCTGDRKYSHGHNVDDCNGIIHKQILPCTQ